MQKARPGGISGIKLRLRSLTLPGGVCRRDDAVGRPLLLLPEEPADRQPLVRSPLSCPPQLSVPIQLA